MAQVVRSVQQSSDDAHDTTSGGFPGFSATNNIVFTGTSSGNSIVGGFRFTSLGIPAGATIDGVSLQLEDLGFSGGTTVVDVGFEDIDDAPTFSAGNSPADRTMTTARIAAHTLPEPGGQPPQLQTVSAQGLIDSLQELVDTYGAIDNVVLLLANNGSSDYNEWTSFDFGSGTPAQLTVDYTEPAGGVALSGTAAATSSASGSLSVKRGLSGSAAGASAASATLSAKRGLSGSVTGASAANGVLGVKRGMSGSASAVSAASGNLTIQSGNLQLSGAATAASSATGTLSVKRGLAGSVAATSAASGILGVKRGLQAAIAAVSTAAGVLGVKRGLSGSASAVSSASGTLIIAAPVITTADARFRAMATGKARYAPQADGLSRYAPVAEGAGRHAPTATGKARRS